MPESNQARILASLASSTMTIERLCAACLELLPGVDGASLTLIADPRAHATVSTAGPYGARLSDLQFTLGEGPYVDANNGGRPVLAADLTEIEFRSRWPSFAAASLDFGLHAVFAFPLTIGAIRVGVLSLHRRAPGPLGVAELADALVFADAATLLVLDRSAPADGRASRLRITHRVSVHQATGMIMAQLGVTVEEAFVRLRAFAFVDGRPLEVVAAEVVARRIRFDVEEKP